MTKKTRTKKKPRGLKHHAKKLYSRTPKFVHGMIVGTFIGIIVVISLKPNMPANALSIASSRDCDSNAVINCGALTTAELKQRYNNKGVAAIYNYFGIKNIKLFDSAVAGRVYKDGTVKTGNEKTGYKTVATKAITAGRENISGSTRISWLGATFYKRPPSVSFQAQSIPAFVVMEKGQFKFAIITSCGNPVIATAIPVTKPTPKPTPKPVPAPLPVPVPEPKPTPKPTPVPEPTPTPPPEEPAPVPEPTPPGPPEVPDIPETPKVVIIPTPSTQTPESTPTPIVTASTTVALPETGPSDIVIVGLFAIIGGYVFHATHRHIRHKRHLRRGM